MEDGLDRPEVVAGRDRLQEFGAVEIVGDAGAGEVGEFLAVGQVVDDDDVVAPPRVEGMDEIGPDEAGPAGDDEHGASSPGERAKCNCAALEKYAAIPTAHTGASGNPVFSPFRAGLESWVPACAGTSGI